VFDGVSVGHKYDDWVNYDFHKLGDARDILEVAVRNGTEYYASWYNGISEMKDGELITKHGYNNTNGVLDTTYYSNNRIRISDLKFDNDGNLWGLSSEVNHPLFVKTKNGEWHSFTMHQSQVDLFFDDLLIDGYNQKWGILGRGAGVFVYNHNNTIENPADDQYKLLNTNVGNGNLPSLQTYSIVEDLDGEIWVGTDGGIGVFYNPSSVFSGGNFDAQQILIQEGDYGQYLLSEEKVKCITIDGANRKWIGTEKSGVFLLSEEGTEELLHFTAENSPLFSNNIIDIAINPGNGEVFIGTEKGLISCVVAPSVASER
jgi:ligand-binding sensor domain-containing protein